MDQDQNSSNEEVAPQESESNVVETNETQEQSPQVERNHEPDDEQEKNWREVRRKQRESDIKIKAQEELIEKLLQAKNSQVQEPVKEPDEFASMDPEDFPTWSQTDKRIEKKAELIAEKKYQELRAKDEQSRFLERLKSKYDDFSDVVNPDSIAVLEEQEPELASTIADLKDPYKMGLQTYHYLKKLNLTESAGKKRHIKEVEKKLEKNEDTVQSPQAYNKRPMAQAFQLTESEKTKLYKEMMGYATQAGGGY